MNRLNDTHAQLMVHWLGEGTNVMLCLGRDPPPGTTDEQKSIEPSSVYISYDNGDTFDDKTSLFRINVTTNNVTTSKPSYIDQFSTHTTYNTVSHIHHYRLYQFEYVNVLFVFALFSLFRLFLQMLETK